MYPILKVGENCILTYISIHNQINMKRSFVLENNDLIILGFQKDGEVC